jgi:hypothetical protein
MMSGMPIETCWAFNKLLNNKFYYKLHLVCVSTESKIQISSKSGKNNGYFTLEEMKEEKKRKKKGKTKKN